MSLMIHNNLTNRKEEFVPIEPGKVKMYVCGVTVYDDIHMGHARSIIVFDVVNRYLRYLGYDVTFVTNFTDVDDKIINRANERGIEALDLSAEYIKKYFEDIEKLGVRRADIYPQASTSMPYIIDMVKEIVDRGYGYPTKDGSVYFRVKKIPDYGILSNRSIEEMRSSGRLEPNEDKEDPMDFAVWKGAKPGEVSWDSPWGKGRPGWHIECSAMIRHYLGDEIDIHGGGNDLIFPHHENEILQTEACTGSHLAHYWMHNGMLETKGSDGKTVKMSKSLKNFFKVDDVAKKFDKYTIRFYYLNTHYSSPLAYGEENMLEAQAALKRLWNNYRDLQACARDGPSGSPDNAAQAVCKAREGFTSSMRRLQHTCRHRVPVRPCTHHQQDAGGQDDNERGGRDRPRIPRRDRRRSGYLPGEGEGRRILRRRHGDTCRPEERTQEAQTIRPGGHDPRPPFRSGICDRRFGRWG